MKTSLWLAGGALISFEAALLFLVFMAPRDREPSHTHHTPDRPRRVAEVTPAYREEIPMGPPSDRAEAPAPGPSSPSADGGVAPAAPVWSKTATAEREHFLQNVQASGAPDSQQLVAIHGVETGWNYVVAKKPDAGAQLGSWRCFKSGCTMTMTYRDSPPAEALLDELMRSEATMRIPGQKFRSGPVETPSGQTEVTWIFYSPDANPG